jgi:hypothetical protein
MVIRRTIVIPIILALSAAGSALAVSAVPATAAQAPSAHVTAAASAMKPAFLYHG